MSEEEKKELEEEKDDDIYDDEDVEEKIENDEIEPEEAGFMEGYNKKQSKKPRDPKDIIEEND